ncbi:protein FAM204A isoform X1 [Hyperolius riggenbachi]|uniref:protein FAM204A isoform X1 n=1 Tax=Hyperolius riggenbachi TaxID=752182 RepID=UPI0035A28B95
MWSGLPEGDVSEEEAEESPESAVPASVPDSCVAKYRELQKRQSELQAECSRLERRGKRRRRGKRKLKRQEALEKETSSAPEKIPALETLQKYFGINEHLDPPVCQKVLKKSRLEESLDEAVKGGDIEEAEEISDKLATRELAVKITKAASCHKYIKSKEEEELSQEGVKKKRKNMPWGFEAKKRWETKSNMGYM